MRRGAFVLLTAVLLLSVAEGLTAVFLALSGDRLHLPDFEHATATDVELDRARRRFHAEFGWTLRYSTPHGERPRGTARGAPRGASSEGPRIAVFGDSFTHGDEVGPSETWPEALGGQLEVAGLEVAVLNFGTSAYGMDQMLLRAERELERVPARDAVLAFISWDIERNLSVYWKFLVPQGGLALTKPRFRLCDPGPSCPGGLELLPNPLRGADQLDRLRDPRFLAELAEFDPWANRFDLPPRGFPALRFLLRPGFRHAVASSNETVDLWRGKPWDGKPWRHEDPPELAARSLLRFAAAARARGATPHLVHLPVVWEILAFLDHGEEPAAARHLRHLCAEHGLDCAFGLDAFRGLSREQLAGQFTQGLDGGHYTAQGNRRVAEYLARMLELSIRSATQASSDSKSSQNPG